MPNYNENHQLKSKLKEPILTSMNPKNPYRDIVCKPSKYQLIAIYT